jgi:hypothetical protein
MVSIVDSWVRLEETWLGQKARGSDMSQEGTHVAVPQIQPALQFASQTFQKHFLFLFAAVFLSGALAQVVFSFFGDWLGGLLAFLYSCVFMGGLLKIMLTFCDGGEPQLSFLLANAKQFWKFVAVNIIAFSLIALGFLLLVIPGFYLCVRLGFYQMAVAERDEKPIAAITYSWEITRGKFWKIFVFNLVSALVMLIPAFIVSLALMPLTALFASLTHASNVTVSRFLSGMFLVPLCQAWFYLCWVHCYRQITRQASLSPQAS